MKTRRLVPYCLVVLLAGCGPIFSVHALYTKETITFEEKLLGRWLVDPNKPENTWEFARLEEDAAERLPLDLRDQATKCYRMNLTDPNGTLSAVACLIQLQGRLFLDLLSDRLPGDEQNPENGAFVNAAFFVRVHTFMRVSLRGDQLKIGLTDVDGVKKLLQAEPKAVQYTFMTDRIKEYPLLTASTEELQAFVTKYADDERLFTDGEPLTRKPSSAAK